MPGEVELLFILVYFKTYPLQEVLAFHFHMSQSQACHWVHILSEVLQWTLRELGHLPERELLKTYMDESQQHEAATELELENFAIDGTECRRQRPKDQEKQKRFYTISIISLCITNGTVSRLSADGICPNSIDWTFLSRS